MAKNTKESGHGRTLKFPYGELKGKIHVDIRAKDSVKYESDIWNTVACISSNVNAKGQMDDRQTDKYCYQIYP